MTEQRIELYDGPAGGWGALKSVGKTLLRQDIPIKGAKTLLSTNQPDGSTAPVAGPTATTPLPYYAVHA